MKLIFCTFSIVVLRFLCYHVESVRNQRCIQYNIQEMIRQLGEPMLNNRGQKIFIPPTSIQSCIYISTTELRNSRPFYQNLIRDNNGLIRRASLLEQNEISMFRQRINAFIMSGGNMQAAMSSNQGDLNGYNGGGGQYGTGNNNGPNNGGGQYQPYGGANSQYGPANNIFQGQYGAGSNQYGCDYQGFNSNDYRAFLRPPCFCQDCSAGLVLYAQGQTNTIGNSPESMNSLESNIVVEDNLVTDADNCITYSSAKRLSFTKMLVALTFVVVIL